MEKLEAVSSVTWTNYLLNTIWKKDPLGKRKTHRSTEMNHPSTVLTIYFPFSKRKRGQAPGNPTWFHFPATSQPILWGTVFATADGGGEVHTIFKARRGCRAQCCWAWAAPGRLPTPTPPPSCPLLLRGAQPLSVYTLVTSRYIAYVIPVYGTCGKEL